MVIWRERFLALILLLLLLGLVACNRSLPGDDLPTVVPTAALGGAEGDPDVGGGQGEVNTPTAAAYPLPTLVIETSPRETVVPPAETESAEPAATTVPPLSPTPEEEPAEAQPEPEATGEEPAAEEAAEATDTIPPVATDDMAPAEAALATSTRTHTVAAGENLYRIGLQYGLSWVVIAQANGLTNADRIMVGQVLVIPPVPGTGGQPEQPTPSPQTETTHTVRPGDNLFRIGIAYGVGWVQIAEANGIVNPSQIYVGQVLKIPVSVPGPMPEFTHQVRPGETLLRIALLYGIPWTAIAQANNLSSPYVIYTGQTLVIPGQ
jgi:LysM repeat protein